MQGPLTVLLSTDEPTVTQSVERALPDARPLVVCVRALAGAGAAELHAAAGARTVVDGLAVAIVAADAVPDGPGIGVGDAFTDLRDARRSFRHARAALTASGGAGARWEDLRADRLLATLPPTALEDVPRPIAELLRDPTLARTLAAYLDHAGDVKQTATALRLSKTALDARLDTIEARAHIDLRNGEDRLLCHVALRLSGARR